MTAEELINQEGYHFLNCKNDVENLMIAYAKMHVKQALEAANKNAYVEFVNFQDNEIFDYSDVLNDDDIGANVNKDSILNAYPESNII